MAETDKHREIAFYIIQALKTYYEGRPDVYVAGNNFVFWEEGSAKARISPDAYVVFGPTPDLRDSYMAWKEGGRLPAVVFEFTSKKTQQEDTDTKLPRYESVLKTPEYFLFDPTGDYLRPRLQGYRLVDDQYVRLELVNDRLHSEQLGLDLVMEGEDLRLYDPARRMSLPTVPELNHQVEEQTQRAEAEAQRAAREARRADAEAARARQEAAARQNAETELTRLRAELDALRSQNL